MIAAVDPWTVLGWMLVLIVGASILGAILGAGKR